MNRRDDHIIRVIVADNQRVSRIGMRSLFEDAPDIVVIAETARGREALAFAREHAPDVLVCEMALGDISGIQIARELSKINPNIALLAFSSFDDQHYIQHALDNGISGYVMKQDRPTLLIDAIRAMARGDVGWMSPRAASKARRLENKKRELDEEIDDHGLNPSEFEILTLLTEGLTADEIAAEIHRSRSTVRGRLTEIYKKLGVEGRHGAIVWGVKHGLYDDHV